MKTTCGIFLINKHKQILIGHPTGMSNRLWSIPKGIKNSCETVLNAAWREVYEETGIGRDEIIRRGYMFRRAMLGCAVYREKEKQLVAFAYGFNGVLTKKPICDSTFYCKVENRRLPEVDRWRWVHYKTAFKYLNETQQTLLNSAIKLGMMDDD